MKLEGERRWVDEETVKGWRGRENKRNMSVGWGSEATNYGTEMLWSQKGDKRVQSGMEEWRESR